MIDRRGDRVDASRGDDIVVDADGEEIEGEPIVE